MRGSFPLLSAPHSLFNMWTDLKRCEKIPGAPTWRWREWIWLYIYIYICMATSWHKRLGARLPPLGSRVRVSVPPCGFRDGRNGVWVGLSRGFSHFPLPQISFHHFSTLISCISFHFISPCDGASGMVGRHPCYSRTYNIGASSHLIPRPDLVLDTSWGYLQYLFICIFQVLGRVNISGHWRP